MPGQWIAPLAAISASLVLCLPPPAAGQARARENSSSLDPRGRMEGSPTDKPARYYVWHDRDGWHLRCCSRHGNRFQGTIRVTGGSFRKCRPIGLDLRGKRPDRWSLSKDRRELQFETFTNTSFDGFDFSVDESNATIQFELAINDKKMPRRIFIGRDGAHPMEAQFTFPAEPEREPEK